MSLRSVLLAASIGGLELESFPTDDFTAGGPPWSRFRPIRYIQAGGIRYMGSAAAWIFWRQRTRPWCCGACCLRNEIKMKLKGPWTSHLLSLPT
ncbi:hypothetical protein LZ30DRAFT_392224 [Colletotrichum cereale]|nr:hypothetical protein LZ30DRAFT_392224 [Colletotrichum cereale]